MNILEMQLNRRQFLLRTAGAPILLASNLETSPFEEDMGAVMRGIAADHFEKRYWKKEKIVTESGALDNEQILLMEALAATGDSSLQEMLDFHRKNPGMWTSLRAHLQWGFPVGTPAVMGMNSDGAVHMVVAAEDDTLATHERLDANVAINGQEFQGGRSQRIMLPSDRAIVTPTVYGFGNHVYSGAFVLDIETPGADFRNGKVTTQIRGVEHNGNYTSKATETYGTGADRNAIDFEGRQRLNIPLWRQGQTDAVARLISAYDDALRSVLLLDSATQDKIERGHLALPWEYDDTTIISLNDGVPMRTNDVTGTPFMTEANWPSATW